MFPLAFPFSAPLTSLVHIGLTWGFIFPVY